MKVYTSDEDGKLHLEINEGVEKIDENLWVKFNNINIKNVEVVTIPASVISIEVNAFSAFTNMKTAFIVNHDFGLKKIKIKNNWK